MKIEVVKELELKKIQHLVETSLEEGFNFVNRLVQEWEIGANRFERSNERFYIVKINDLVVGFGGINEDPYKNNPKIGRVRHLYIAPSYRRKGIGEKLIKNHT